MEKQIKINISAADGVTPNSNYEQSTVNNIHHWLKALVDEFDKEKAEVDLFIDKESNHRISFSNISKELESKAVAELQKFRKLV